MKSLIFGILMGLALNNLALAQVPYQSSMAYRGFIQSCYSQALERVVGYSLPDSVKDFVVGWVMARHADSLEQDRLSRYPSSNEQCVDDAYAEAVRSLGSLIPQEPATPPATPPTSCVISDGRWWRSSPSSPFLRYSGKVNGKPGQSIDLQITIRHDGGKVIVLSDSDVLDSFSSISSIKPLSSRINIEGVQIDCAFRS